MSLPDRYSDPSSGLDQTAPWCCGGPCRHMHIRRADNDSCARGLRGLSRLHDSGRWLGTRLGHIPVRRVRGRSEGSDLETDPRLLLPRHPAEHYVRRNQDQSPDQRRQRQQSASTARDWPYGPRHRRASLHSAQGAKYTSWRISRSGTGYRLSYRTSSGTYVTKSTGLTTGTWSFSTGTKIVKVVLPNGSVRPYRGTVALIKSGTGGRTVNDVLLEDYVKAVVPAEMPTSWAANAVCAQAVAARSYAVRLRKFSGSSGYHICDTTACQLYGGMSRDHRRQRSGQRHDRGHCHLPRGGRTHSIPFVKRWTRRERRLPVPPCARRSL